MAHPVAFEQIYKGYKNLVYNLCLHYVLNPEDAQDITQEVFVKIYQRYHQYDAAAASLKTWICRITINHSLDFLKAKKTKKRFGFLTSLFHPETNEPIASTLNVNHPGVTTEDKEGLETLLRIIYSLPENQKTAFILSKIDGLSNAEISEIMLLSLSSVESLVFRAKTNLKDKLSNKFEEYRKK